MDLDLNRSVRWGCIALLLLTVSAIAQTPPVAEPSAEPASPVQAGTESQNDARWFLQIFGPGMWPLWLCSILLIAILLERRKSLRPQRILDQAMIDRVAELVARKQLDEAQKVAQASDTVVGKAWSQGIHEFNLGGTTLADTLTQYTLLALKPLRKNLAPLQTIGVISPLLGLLGTVVGMIITFYQIAATGGADKSRLAGGIGLALFTTAGGLIVAIPAIIGNRYYTARITGIAEQAEEAISRINFRYSHAMAGGNAPASAAPVAKSQPEADDEATH